MFYCGVDISSKRIGISIINDLQEIERTQTYKFDLENQKEKRMILKKMVLDAMKQFNLKKIYLEEVRLFSYSGNSNYFISEKAIFRLISLIVTLMNEDVEVYKISPISWKTRILKWKGYGTKKEDSIKFIKNTYNLEVNDDQADSICIALYAREYGKEKAKLID